MEKILKNSVYDNYLNTAKNVTHSYISALLLLLPLIITNGYFNITETKLVTFYALSGIYIVTQLALFLFYAIRKKRVFLNSIPYKLSLIDGAFICFGLAYVVSAVFSSYGINDVVFGIGSRYQGVLTISLYVALYFVLTRTFSFSAKCLVWAGIGFSVTSIIAVLNGFSIDPLNIYLSLTGDNLTDFVSTIGNINFYSAYYNLLLPIFVVGFCMATDKKTTAIFGGFVVCGALGMVFTSSESFLFGFLLSMLLLLAFLMTDKKAVKRFSASCCLFLATIFIYTKLYFSGTIKGILHYEPSALMSMLSTPVITIVLLVAFVFLVFVVNKKEEWLPTLKKVYCIALASVVALFILSFVLMSTVFIREDVGAIGEYLKFDESWGTFRGRNWILCIERFLCAPLINKFFGFGPETYYHFTDDIRYYEHLIFDQVHNEYLQYLISVGIFGLGAYLSIIINIIKKSVKSFKECHVSMGILCGLIAYWVQAILNIAQPFTTPIMFVFIAVLCGLSTTENTTEKP